MNDPFNLSPEDLDALIAMMSGGETFGVGHEMFNSPMPEGRNVGRTYVAASPFEHLAAGVNRGLGAYQMAQGQQARSAGIEAYINALRGRQPQPDMGQYGFLRGFDDPNNFG